MKRIFKHTLILLLTLGTTHLYAQVKGQPLIDSLLKVLPGQKDDTNKVRILNTLAGSYSAINYDEGIKYGQQELELATKLNWKNGIASAYNKLGDNNEAKSDYPKALVYYSNALKLFEELGNTGNVSMVLSNIGIVNFDQGDYPKALEYYLKALKLDDESGSKERIGCDYLYIGNVYFQQADTQKALEYDFMALKLAEETGNKENIAALSCNIGNIFEAKGDYPKALEYSEKALKQYEELGSKHFIAMVTDNIANLYLDQRNYTEGIAWHYKALKIAEETGNKYTAAMSLGNIGASYVAIVTDKTKMSGVENSAEGKRAPYAPDSLIPSGRSALLHKAVAYLQRAITIDKEIRDLNSLEHFYESLSIADSLLGDYRGSLEAYRYHTLYRDSVFNEAKNSEIIRLGMIRKMDVDSLKAVQARQVVEMKYHQQRTYTYLGIAGMVLLIGFSFFIVKERSKSEKERKKSDSLLLNILPAEVAEELKTHGASEARHFEKVTILFTDFVNFTEAGERMTAKELIDELHHCFKKFDEITSKYNVEKIKTIGDAYLAVAGLPTADPKHAENIVGAAKEISAFMQDRLAKLGNSTFEVRIGIHSGSVVAGIVGVKKFAYDIWGDTVNTAARMEQNSAPGKINISQTTYELVKDKFACEYRGEIDAKGKGAMKMYYVS